MQKIALLLKTTKLSDQDKILLAMDILTVVTEDLDIVLPQNFAQAKRTIGKQTKKSDIGAKLAKCHKLQEEVHKNMTGVEVGYVKTIPCVKLLESSCEQVLKDAEKDPRDALYQLALKCDDNLLDEAIAAIKKDTRSAGTTDAKIKQAVVIFGEQMVIAMNTAEALSGVIKSAESVLRLVIAKSASIGEGKFNLGDVRIIFERAQQYNMGRASSSGAACPVAAPPAEHPMDEDDDDDDADLASALLNSVTVTD